MNLNRFHTKIYVDQPDPFVHYDLGFYLADNLPISKLIAFKLLIVLARIDTVYNFLFFCFFFQF